MNGIPAAGLPLGALCLLASLALIAACDRDADPVTDGPTTTPRPVETVRVLPTATAQSTPTPIAPGLVATPTAQGGTENIEPPTRDLFELAHRLRPPPGGPVPRTVNPSPVSYKFGHTETFWVSDLVDNTSYTVQATLMVVSEHAYWYVDDTTQLSESDMSSLEKAARVFEAEIHPLITRAFGDIWSPGVDNDPHLTVLHTSIRATAGYFGSQDEYPRQIHPQSNQREMIYMDSGCLRLGSDAYLGVLTHEFQHAIHWNWDPGEDAWVNEGMSEVAQEMAGGLAQFTTAFLQNPGTQLNYWPDEITDSGPHYGASTLFFTYLAQRYGGYEDLKDLVRQPADGIAGVDAYLASYGSSFQEVFKDWIIANYLDASEGRYGYSDRLARVRDVEPVSEFGEVRSTLSQFAARYIDLRLDEGDATVSFHGDTEVAQVAARCRSGRYCWWGNRGDSIDSTLTRSLDLSGLDEATLEFWTWFETEKDWDYAYVEVSTDDGGTWTILEGRLTSSENPMGNNYGHGFTGTSEGWARERIDLSPYAGGEVLVRFEYITDDTVYLDGFVIDDVAVPEIGFFDDAENDRGWQSEGFVRTDNVLSQEYLVQVIELDTDGRVTVKDLVLDKEKQGQLVIRGFGSTLEHAVIVLAPVTAGTHLPASYVLNIAPAE